MRRFLRNEGGGAAVEFGLIAPVLSVVLVGIATSAGLLTAHHKMRQAVSTGAQYAMTVSDDAGTVEDVVLAAWDDPGDDADVEIAQFCACADVDHACDSLCEDGDYPLRHTEITATMTHTGFGGHSQMISAVETVRTR